MMVDAPATFGTLWKGTNFSNMRMNRTPLPAGSPLVNTPKTASAGLIRQATQKLWKGENRKAVMAEVVTSTLRKPAVVRAAPAVASPAPSPAPAAAPAPAAPAASGFGGAGYSGNNAAILGQMSNPGWTQPA